MMTSAVFIAACAVFAATSLYIVACFLTVFFQENRSGERSLPHLLVSGLYLILKFILYVGFFLPDINLMLSVLSFVLLLLPCRASLKYKVTGGLLMILFSMGAEVISLYATSLVTGLPIETFQTDQGSYLLVNSFILLILLVSVKSYQLLSDSRAKEAELDIASCLRIMAVPGITALILYLLNHNLAVSEDQSALIIVTLLLLLINVLICYLYEKLLTAGKAEAEHRLLQAQMQYYVEQYAQMNKNLEDIRTIRHDLKHHLLYIQSRLKTRAEQDLDQLEQDLEQLIGKTAGNDGISYTNNPSLDAMLNYKINMANQQKIEIKIRSEISSQTPVHENVMHVILCNLLDNAIEFFDPNQSELKQIEVKLYEERQNLYIQISNPYSHLLKFRGKTLITSKKEKDMHGLGLRSVEKLVEEQKGHMRLRWGEHIFTVEIVLFGSLKN